MTTASYCSLIGVAPYFGKPAALNNEWVPRLAQAPHSEKVGILASAFLFEVSIFKKVEQDFRSFPNILWDGCNRVIVIEYNSYKCLEWFYNYNIFYGNHRHKRCVRVYSFLFTPVITLLPGTNQLPVNFSFNSKFITP